jgi:uncharacterized protein
VTRVALLDVNVLVALFDPDHVHHEAAHDWFAANRKGGWAYSAVHGTPAMSARPLESFCASGQHVFWPDEVSLRERQLFDWSAGVTHRQLTDVYLLGLARHKRGRYARGGGYAGPSTPCSARNMP